jgi:hypothetical protein
MVSLIEKKYDRAENCYGINLILQLLYENPNFRNLQISQECSSKKADSILPDQWSAMSAGSVEEGWHYPWRVK